MSEDIVAQLRGWSEGSSDDSRRMVWLMRQSADTIEALRGENARLKTQVQFASETDPAMRAEAAEAEAARLKAALVNIKALGFGAPTYKLGRNIGKAVEIARKALAGETT